MTNCPRNSVQDSKGGYKSQLQIILYYTVVKHLDLLSTTHPLWLHLYLGSYANSIVHVWHSPRWNDQNRSLTPAWLTRRAVGFSNWSSRQLYVRWIERDGQSSMYLFKDYRMEKWKNAGLDTYSVARPSRLPPSPMVTCTMPQSSNWFWYTRNCWGFNDKYQSETWIVITIR